MAGNWEEINPEPAARPVFYQNHDCLQMLGGGHKEEFGYFRKSIPIKAGAYYRFQVQFQAEKVENINLHVMNLLMWDAGNGIYPHDMITNFQQKGPNVIGEQIFQAHEGCHSVEIQLGMRYSADGKITWKKVQLEEVDAPSGRPVRISVVKWSSLTCKSEDECRKDIANWLETAGQLRSDLILLPEFSYSYDGAPYFEIEVDLSDISHPLLVLLSQAAKRYRMYVAAGIIEKDNGYQYNTTVIFDRTGSLLGKYRKIHLYWPEEFWHGTTPGDELPVFQLDFGKVGIMTCYDSWYGETARLLALKGAELILFPNAGYEERLMPARAIDNSVFLAISSMNCQAAVYDTRGNVLSSTLEGIASAKIDLACVYLPHANAGGNMNASPGGKRGMRNACSDQIYQEICMEMQQYLDRPTKYVW